MGTNWRNIARSVSCTPLIYCSYALTFHITVMFRKRMFCLKVWANLRKLKSVPNKRPRMPKAPLSHSITMFTFSFKSFATMNYHLCF